MRFALAYDGPEAIQAGQRFVERADDGSEASGLSLVDAGGRNRYLILRDATGACFCSELDLWFNPGTRQTGYAQFPAPPGAVRSMAVYVPSFPPVEDVRLVEG